MARTTINDVARLAQVGTKTVSRVINREARVSATMRAKVEAAIAALAYVPNPQARALARGRGALIVLFYDPADDQSARDAQAGAALALAGSEFALAVHPLLGVDDLRLYLERHRPFGAVLLPPFSSDDALIIQCRAAQCPAIELCADDIDRCAARDAVEWLIAKGHRSIGFIAGPDEHPSARMRELGYMDALADHDLDRGADLVAIGDFSFESGCVAGDLLLEVSPRPTSILAANEAMAAGVMRAAQGKGLTIPDDLSIIGIGDGALANSLTPPLTTMRLLITEMAQSAVLNLIEPDAYAPMPEQFRARLIERGSTGHYTRMGIST